MPVSLIVLAAGMGTRMNSDLPKVLHKVAAAPLLHHALQAGASLAPEKVVVVTGHGAEEVARAARDEPLRARRKGCGAAGTRFG
jgi:bifunctional UDP-N-acetylglucosamine pyrophosphorylase/glucosamine-1-phosphate N-acetyltransferase